MTTAAVAALSQLQQAAGSRAVRRQAGCAVCCLWSQQVVHVPRRHGHHATGIAATAACAAAAAATTTAEAGGGNARQASDGSAAGRAARGWWRRRLTMRRRNGAGRQYGACRRERYEGVATTRCVWHTAHLPARCRQDLCRGRAVHWRRDDGNAAGQEAGAGDADATQPAFGLLAGKHGHGCGTGGGVGPYPDVVHVQHWLAGSRRMGVTTGGAGGGGGRAHG